VLTTYGRSSGFCLDPIEKKPLNHFLPGTAVLSFGTTGCNLTCKFCHNWDISKAREMDRLMDLASPEAIAEAGVHLQLRQRHADRFGHDLFLQDLLLEPDSGFRRVFQLGPLSLQAILSSHPA
jgi:hypothetical protein